MAYKYLNRSAVLEHLQEGQTVNIDEYIEKMQFFKKYGNCQGIYIADSRYIEYAEIGLHYFKYDTLIKFFEDFKQRKERSARIEKFTCRRSDPLYSPHWGKHRTIETRRGVSVQTPFLVLPIIRSLYASNQDPGKL